MWLPDRRMFLLGPLALAACGFQPVYRPGGTGATLQNRVLIDAPDDRNTFLLVRELEERLGRVGTAVYGLSLNVATVQEGLAIDSQGDTERFNLLGAADWALTDLDTGQVVASGRVDNFTGYSATGSTIATLAAEEDAQKRLMAILADQIVSRLFATDLS